MKKRIPHIIKDSMTAVYPHRFMFFDTETREVDLGDGLTEHKLKLGVSCYWEWRYQRKKNTEVYEEFESMKAFWDMVERRALSKTKLYLVAHNISFDFKVLNGFKTLKRRGWKLRKLILNGTTNIWEWRKDKSTIVCLDNMNYFKVALSTLGESIGIPKLDIDFSTATKKELLTYCKRDVEVMVRAWENWLTFLKSNDLGCFGKTVAAQAFNAYRHKFMPTEIYIHTAEDAVELERSGYFGGRTEAFFIGELPKEQYYYLDINSMYPFCMLNNEYPSKFKGHLIKPTVADLKTALKSHAVMARVRLETKHNAYPVRWANKLVFPTGKIITTLTTRELQRAVRLKEIRGVEEMIIYEKAPLFNEYVKFFYGQRNEYRAEGNHSFAYLTKIMLNSLYGKFGQRNEVFDTIAEGTDYEDGYMVEWNYDIEEWEKYRVLAGTVEKSVGFREGFNSMVGIPAHITADARLLLYEYMEKAGKSNVYYCDTDSLFTNSRGFSKLEGEIDKSIIGKLSIEDQAETLTINTLKDYKLGDKVKMKGIRRDAEKIGDNTYKQIAFEGLKGSLQHKRTDKQVTMFTTKTLSRKYTKGEVTKSGKVVPYKFNMF